MILSAYQNPPYKDPTRMRPATPPRSPKRKHGDISSSPSVQADSVIEDAGGEASITNSPRMKVAQRLKDLNIQPSKPVELQQTIGPSTVRKRVKRSLDSTIPSSLKKTSDTSLSDARVGSTFGAGALRPTEIPETPDGGNYTPNANNVGLASSREGIASSDTSDEETILVSLTRLSPTPGSRQPDSFGAAVPNEPDRSVSPLPFSEELTSDQAALTWQENEITGHDIDPGGGDDGEGINGVGFKPTPAMAYARRQRRKQQISEYKAREARDARQKRIEKRRGSTLERPASGQKLDEDKKRIVRFVEFG